MSSNIKPLLMLLSILSSFVFASQNDQTKLFKESNQQIINTRTGSEQIDFKADKQPVLNDFFRLYQKSMGLSTNNSFAPLSEIRDGLGQEHIRYQQKYKGIPLADMAYILHTENGKVFRSNGSIVRGINTDIRPTISEGQALQNALDQIHARRYMWQSDRNEIFLKKEQNNPDASFFPKGRLMLSSGRQTKTAANFKLIYRFDIYASEPFSRQWVDVDAHNGEIVNVISRIWSDDIATSGQSRYDNMVPITVSDQNFPKREYTYWHTSRYSALGDSGTSWWMADSTIGFNGGYANVWYQTLDSDPITLSGDNLSLQFEQRYAVESPGGEPAGYDGWDGMNVRISIDGGNSWQVLTNPQPAYTATSLNSFGTVHGEGQNIPGWAGENRDWHSVNFDLSAYNNQTVQIRFAFASDAGFSTVDGDSSLFGWQLDNIQVKNSTSTLFSNDGRAGGLTPNVREIIVAGNYRLRRAAAPGIMTFTTNNTTSYSLAEDVVSNDSVFADSSLGAAVEAQWVAEEVFKYFFTEFNRNSYDNKGSRILSYVNFDNNYENAFWDGSRMTFGDGKNNNGPLTTVDVGAHELTHAVTEYSANLVYQDESGALNESFSDVFGTAVEFYVKPDKANWVIGEDLGIFRSMSHPESYGDPNTYGGNNWHEKGGSDNGGVHTNSGVQNKWFYLLSAGDAGTNDKGDNYNVSGIGVSDAAKIAYRNLTVYLTPSAQYADARQGSIMSARDLFGEKSPQYASTIAAWDAVGVYNPPARAQVLAPTMATLQRAEVNADSDTLHLIVSNGGLDTLVINNISFDDTHFQALNTLVYPLRLLYKDSMDIQVVFVADSAKTVNARMWISANDTVSVPLRGEGFIVHAVSALQKYALSGNALFSLEDTGPAVELGKSGIDGFTSMAIRPSDYILIGAAPEETQTTFYRLNAKSGEAFKLTTVPFGGLDKIVFGTGSDLPLAVNSQSGVLYRLDLMNGQADSIGVTGLQTLSDLMVNPQDNSLWATLADGSLYTINKQTALATFQIQSDQGDIRAADFDANGQLFALSGVSGNPADLLSIDTQSGQTTSLGPLGADLISLSIADANATAINQRPGALPQQFMLRQNYPNPFNPLTRIEFTLPRSVHVSLAVYNTGGQQVAELISANLNAGSYSATFDASALASGVYVYVLRAGTDFVQSKKLILLK